jgi:hypothetical protein
MAMDFDTLMRSAGEANRISRESLAYAQSVARKNQALEAQYADLARNAEELKNALSRVQVQTRVGDPSIQRIENMPGTRIPFDMVVDIAIPANSTNVVQGTFTVPQDGPFIAVSRCATLLSAMQFQFTAEGQTQPATFFSRSYGRYRPVHSAWDLNDGQPFSQVVQAGLAYPGNGSPYVISPSNASSWRSMEGDFRILMRNQGSSFPRSNQEVPSTFWTKSINEPWELGALDVFERGEVVQYQVLPLHANNAAFGNIQGFLAGGQFPFIDSQWDAVEGINDTLRALSAGETDPVVRLPNAVMSLVLHGYIIRQPPGAGPH